MELITPGLNLQNIICINVAHLFRERKSSGTFKVLEQPGVFPTPASMT